MEMEMDSFCLLLRLGRGMRVSVIFYFFFRPKGSVSSLWGFFIFFYFFCFFVYGKNYPRGLTTSFTYSKKDFGLTLEAPS